jgi:hypothetical protein
MQRDCLFNEIGWSEAADVGDEKPPVFSRQPWRAASKLADAKKWRSRSEQDVSNGRLRVAYIRAEESLWRVALRMTARAGFGF